MLAGPDWVEGGDAGSTVGTAQYTFGVGQINSISGTLGGTGLVPDFEDMYIVRVTTPMAFQMSLFGGNFDAQLFVFNITQANEAFGLLANDNTPAGNSPVLTNLATDGTGAKISFPGVYAVAISAAGRYPISLNGAIFNYTSPTEISGPDGPGGINPHIDWAGPGQAGSYQIQTIGVGFYDTPSPGSGAVLGMGALLLARRRRR